MGCLFLTFAKKSEMPPFSALLRDNLLTSSSTQSYDLIVIGGGVTGAGIALDASLRGLKVLLLEKKDFAWGTSSRSTKLIHGGLRYLKQFEFGLVREVGMERAIVYKNARHLVRPEKMLLPIVKNGSLGKTMTSLGLWVYDFLAGVSKEERRRMIDKPTTKEAEPLLRDDILLGGGLYYEYRTDDARLTISLMKSAVEAGAVCLNYTEVKSFIYNSAGKIDGLMVDDVLSGGSITFKGAKVVNAAGPWVDTLRKIETTDPDSAAPKKRLHLTKGVHLVFKRERVPLQQSAYFDVKDGRMIFAIPRGDNTYIGTTDTNYKGEIDSPNTTKDDVGYLISATNEMFPSLALKPSDVISTWSGLRPLIHEEGKDPSELSRKDEVFHSKGGLISIAGGKLTGYRKMAQRIVDLVCKELSIKEKCSTKVYRLAGAEFDSEEAIALFTDRSLDESKQASISPNAVRFWVNLYGTRASEIIERCYETVPNFENPEDRALFAEIWYCVNQEMTLTACDFFVRRTGRLYFNYQSITPDIKNKAITYMASLFGWDDDRKQNELKDLDDEMANCVGFR